MFVMLTSMDTRAAVPPDIAARTLMAALRAVVTDGLKPVEASGIPDATVVHDLRKALKHWRAIMRLIAPVVGAEAETMRLEARDLARQIAAARDGRAAQEAFLDLLEEREGDQLSDAVRAAITARLDTLRAGAEATGLTPARLAKVSEMWKRAGHAIERWPLARFDCSQAARQLGASYRRARRAIPKDWTDAGPEALHRLRQRVVEHRYQMEIAEPLWPKVMRVWVLEAQRLRDRLGSHHDLVILQHLSGAGQPLSRWRSQLAPLIATRQTAHMVAARRLTGRLFAETPKAFVARMASLWEHCAASEKEKGGLKIEKTI